MKKINEDVERILDGWFGESLENSENENQLRRYLYEPLSDLVEKTKKEANVPDKRYPF